MRALTYLLPSMAATALSHLYCKIKNNDCLIELTKRKPKCKEKKENLLHSYNFSSNVIFGYSSSFHNDQWFEVTLEVYYPVTHYK